MIPLYLITLWFLLWGLVWDRADQPNVVIKVILFALTFFGCWSEFHRAGLPEFFAVSMVFSLYIAIIWKTNSILNFLVKMLWSLTVLASAYEVIKLT